MTKGYTVFKFKKVKGHATQQHLDAGIINSTDLLGNTRADKLATHAQTDCDQQVGHLAEFFGFRQKAYGELVRNIHNFLLDMFQAIEQGRAMYKKSLFLVFSVLSSLEFYCFS